jgi:hypothetical protein
MLIFFLCVVLLALDRLHLWRGYYRNIQQPQKISNFQTQHAHATMLNRNLYARKTRHYV